MTASVALARHRLSRANAALKEAADEVRPLRDDVERFISACEAALAASDT